MPDQPPIACSLGPDDLTERLDRIASVGRESLVSAELRGGRAVLRFAPDARPALDDIVAAEARCCAFLEMHLHDDRDALVLTIDPPAGAEPVVEELVAAFAAR
jgi:hypothetical protein